MLNQMKHTLITGTLLLSCLLFLLVLGCPPMVQCQLNKETNLTEQIGSTSVAPRLKLTVYFESRCPDSRRFYVQQLGPNFKDLSQIIDLHQVPFGHARVLSKDKMICQHGPRECEGNRMMACILASNSSTQAKVDTFTCMFENSSPLSRDCVRTHLPALSYEALDKCRMGDESFQMMIINEKLTGRVGYIPHFTLNDQSSEDIQQGVENDLKNYLCKMYKGPKTKVCRDGPRL